MMNDQGCPAFNKTLDGVTLLSLIMRLQKRQAVVDSPPLVWSCGQKAIVSQIAAVTEIYIDGFGRLCVSLDLLGGG